MTNQQQPFWQRTMFLIGVSLLFTHELDAMTHEEWKLLPLTSRLNSDIGRLVFVIAHVPIFALVLGWLTSQIPRRVASAQFWIALFLVVHAVLHLAFSGQPEYSFNGILSNILIFGAALCGSAYLWGCRRNNGAR